MDQGLLAAFVDYIQTRKTVKLDELAADFGLRIQVSPNPDGPRLNHPPFTFRVCSTCQALADESFGRVFSSGSYWEGLLVR